MDNSQKVSIPTQLHNFARTIAAGNQQNQPKTIQGHISQILENDFLEFTIDATGPYTLPKMKIPQAFSKYHREPTQVGDKGYAVPNDFYVGGESGDAGGTASMYPRGNLATHVFHPISVKSFPTRDPNLFLVTGGPSGHKTQSQDTTTFHLIDSLNNLLHTSSANITHTAAELMTHTAQDIWHQAKDTITHQAENAINHIATNSMVHAVLNGEIQHIAQSITMGAPSSTDLLDDPPNPPQPSLPTILNIIGSLSASQSISAAGNISGGNMQSGGEDVMTRPIPPQLIDAPRIVTGSRGDVVSTTGALYNLIQALVLLGLIEDQTTA
jgi:hypothetical protein